MHKIYDFDNGFHYGKFELETLKVLHLSVVLIV